MNQSFDPSRYGGPAPTGPPTGAKVLISVALIGIAAAVGWVVARGVRDELRSGDARPRAPIERWTFTSLDAAPVCEPDGQSAVERNLLQPTKAGPVPVRLADHMPDASPIEAFQRAYDGPTTDLSLPWQRVLALHGVGQAYARTFNSQGRPGGFTVYAYEFPSKGEATAGAAAAYRTFVCDFGADPHVVQQRPGIVAGVRISQSTVAWWVHGRRLIEIDYAMYGDEEEDVAAALTVLRTVWNMGEPHEGNTSTA
jgi:hypothetical protein